MVSRIWDAWPVYVGRWYARRLWDDLPGPAWCKTLLIILCVLIPGAADELALVALAGLCRRWRAAHVTP